MILNQTALNHAPRRAPGVKAFAILAGIDSAARAILISVFPVAMYRLYGDAQQVSEIYFCIGVLSFLVTLIVPWISRKLPRRWLYSGGVGTYILSALICAYSDSWMFTLGLGLFTFANVVVFVCSNAYVMDYVNRVKLGECEALRLFYSGAAWTIGPFLGIWLMTQWKPAPFILSAAAGCVLLGMFWYFRLGNGKAIQKSNSQTPNPFAYLNRFLHQPRLVAGWTFAVMKSCGWWVYILYLPIFAVQNGHSEQLGGALLSLSNAFLFLTPLILKAMRGRIRLSLIIGFFCSGSFFLLASIDFAGTSVSIVMLVLASMFMILLDICAGLPFLMAVRPSQRTEMSAVYATYRDVSSVITPGVASLLLLFAPLKTLFGLTAVSYYGCALIAGKLHPRLGVQRSRPLEIEPLTSEATSG